MNLLRIAARVAARSDVLNAVDAAFDAAGVYPPVMKEVSPGVYEGEIDAGWTLEAKDAKGGATYRLNQKGIAGPAEAAAAFKKKDPRYSGKLPAGSSRPSGPPTFEEDNVYSLYPLRVDEDGGSTERYFDVKVWDLPDGSHYVAADMVGGEEPVGPGFQLEGVFDKDWNASWDNHHFFYYMLSKTKHPLSDSVFHDKM